MVLPSGAPQISDLDLLLSVESRGSVGKAAREQGISQPAASLRLRTMERRLGVRLLERSSSGSKLTPEGAVLAKCAQAAVDAVRELMACNSALRCSSSENLRIAGSLAMVEYLVPRWLSSMKVGLGDAHVEIRADGVNAICEQVRTGKVDLGFIKGASRCFDLAEKIIGHDELVVVVGPHHPWARRSSPVTLDELTSIQLVLRERGSGTRELAEELLSVAASDRRNCLELPSTTAIKQAVARGSGAAMLSLFAVARELQDGALVRVHVEGVRPTRLVRAVWSKARGLNERAQELLDIASSDGTATSLPTASGSPGTERPRSDYCPGPADTSSRHAKAAGVRARERQRGARTALSVTRPADVASLATKAV